MPPLMPSPPPYRRRPPYRDWNTLQLAALALLVMGPPPGPLRQVKANEADIHQPGREPARSDVSRPFPRPQSARIAVKVINHLGDEAMKVLPVG